MARLVLETPLPTEECFRRLEAATDTWPWLPVRSPSDALMARVRPPRFRLTRHEYYFFSPFKEVFYGRIIEEAGITRVYGRLGLPLPVLVFFSIVLGSPAATVVPSLSAVPALDRFEVLLPLCWVATFYFFRLIGAWDYGGPEDRYSTFLSEVLLEPEARVTSVVPSKH